MNDQTVANTLLHKYQDVYESGKTQKKKRTSKPTI